MGASLKTWGNNGFNFDSTKKILKSRENLTLDTKSCHLMNVLKSTGQGMFVSYQQDVAIAERERSGLEQS